MLNPQSNYFEDTKNISVSEVFSYAVGSYVAYKINDKFQARLGIDYIKMGFKWTYDQNDYTPAQWAILTSASPELLNWKKTTLAANYYFIGIPIDITYSVLDYKAIEIYLKGGGCIYYSYDGDWSTKAQFTGYTEEQTYNTTSYANNRDYRFCVQFGFGLAYTPTNHITLFAEPTYQQITDKVKNTFPLKGNLYNTGVTIGIQYNFARTSDDYSTQ